MVSIFKIRRDTNTAAPALTDGEIYINYDNESLQYAIDNHVYTILPLNTHITGNIYLNGYITAVSITGSLSGLVNNINVTEFSTSVDLRLDLLESASSSFSQSITNLSSSVNNRLVVVESVSSSSATALNALSGAISIKDGLQDTHIVSLQANYVSASTITSLSSSVNSRLVVVEGRYATTGSNTFYGDQLVTGSMYISGDLVVQGSSSLHDVTASAVDIGTNIVKLNTATPAVRFAGVQVTDSGSTATTGSLLWDSLWNRWIRYL